MNSLIAEKMNLKYEPFAIILSDTKPDDARQFKEGKWGCVMFQVAAAARGSVAAFDRKTFGCFGGGVGLGFGNQYKNFPGGEECFCHFLSVGNKEWETGRQASERVKPFLRPESYDDFVNGEGYIKSPELVHKFIEELPITDVPAEYVLFKPLSRVDDSKEEPKVVIFLADMDQVSGLCILANYNRPTNENVIFPYCAGCQSIGIYPFKEAESENPRAVLGLNDISARVHIKRLLKDDLMSFAAPYSLYKEMEENVPGGFLERHTWKNLMALKDR